MVTLTELAAQKAKQRISKRDSCCGLRIGIKTSGCSGLAYILEYVVLPDADDNVFTSFDVNIYVDSKSLPYVNGLIIDWKREGLNEGFDFNNPNVRDECGCGESFRI